MRTKILSDSTCDLSPELLEKYDIGIMPLYIIKDGQEFRDGVTITPLDIFEHVSQGGDLCTTSACAEYDYEQCFSEYAPKYDAVIHINIGSGFSSCHQNARLAAEEFDNVYVVDSNNLSSGQGLVVVAAAKMAEQGMDASEIVERLNELTSRVEASFLIERLDYLSKGGRCSAITAFGANLLNLKPCIEVKDGKMVVVKKYRGFFEKCISQYVRERLNERTDIENDLIFVTHAAATDESVKVAEEGIEQYGNFEEVIETNAGCTVSCHCGPHTLGILFVRK